MPAFHYTRLARFDVFVAVASFAALLPACSSNSTPAGPADASSPAPGATGSTPSADAAGTAADASDAAVSADGSDGFSLTSPAFTDGQAIPSDNTCAGANTSPELDWTTPSASAQSYAIVITDLDTGGTNDAGVTTSPIIHWVIWDIPPATRSLPAMLPGDPMLASPSGAKQVDLRTMPDAGTAMNGYFGPCPRGKTHHYQFALHAMDVATLPGVTTDMTSVAVKAVVLQHSIEQAVLIGTSDAGPPTDAGGQ